jgi:hypothetical protein
VGADLDRTGRLKFLSAIRRQEAYRIAEAISADARASGHKLVCRYAGAWCVRMERQSEAGLLRNFDYFLGWNASHMCCSICRGMLPEP